MPNRCKIKVAFILTPITFGGSEKVSINFFSTVDRSSFEITPILILRPWEEEPHFHKELSNLGYEKSILKVYLNKCGGVKSVFQVAWSIFNILKNNKYDVVHTNGYFADICTILTARLYRMKCVSTCHGFISNSKKLKFYNNLNRLFLRLFHRIIAVSDDIKQDLLRFNLKSEKILVLTNAVDACPNESQLQVERAAIRKSLQSSNDTFVLGTLGRLSEEKGLFVLLEAFRDLFFQGANVNLIIVGDGPERNKLEQYTRTNRIENRVHFAGFQSNTLQWLASVDCFVLPSFTEGTPLSLLEAMSIGLPVIATSVGGVPQVISHNQNGFLVPPGSASAIVDQVIKMLNHECDLEQLSKRAQLTIRENYNLNSWCSKIEKIYMRLVDESF